MDYFRFLKSVPNLTGKQYVVTGANAGLGFALTKTLLLKGARVIMANRNAFKSEEAIKKLTKETMNSGISYRLYDQSSKDDIIRFSKALKAEGIVIDGFVLNAGLFMPKRGTTTKEDVAITFGVNYLGNYFLVKALNEAGLLRKETRLVFTSSLAGKHSLSRYDLKRLVEGGYKNRYTEYKGSKSALNAFVYALMAKSDVLPFKVESSVYVYHPGISNSTIARFKSRFMQKSAHFILRLVFHAPRVATLGALKSLTTTADMHFKMFVPRGLWQVNGYPKIKKMRRETPIVTKDLVKVSESFN